MPLTDSRPQTVGELLASAQGPLYSFEFFPPRSEEEEPVLWAAVDALAPLAPDFVSVTYGANGSRRDRTIHATRRIASSNGPLTVGHLTCVAQSKAELDGISMACRRGSAVFGGGHTDTKVSRPSAKSRVPKTRRDSPFLSPLVHVLPRSSHSGWNSRHNWQPKRASIAVKRTATL